MSKYYEKYLLYKNKYLLLKNQYGSSNLLVEDDSNTRNVIVLDNDLTSDFYLPCEITHLTTKIYCNNITKEKLNYPHNEDKISDNVVIDILLLGLEYKQDPYIQLYNGSQYYNIYINYLVSRKDLIKKKNICDSDKCIFKYIYQTIPDIVKIRNEEIVPVFGLKLIEGNTKEIIEHNVDALKYDLTKYLELNITNSVSPLGEQSKGGNFISGPELITTELKAIFGYPIFYISGIPEELKTLLNRSKCHLIELECSFKTNGFRHIDELMCFMPYGKNTDGSINYKIWFYDILDNYSFNEDKNILEKLKNEINTSIKNYKLNFDNKDKLEKIQNEIKTSLKSYKLNLDEIDNKIKLLNDERLINLNIICKYLFNGNYNDNKDKFVFFKFYDYFPSILNRLWIETSNKCYCIYPEINIAIKNKDYDEIYTKFSNEIINVKSCINPNKKIIPIPLKVKNANPKIPEGGAHCLIKQRFSL